MTDQEAIQGLWRQVSCVARGGPVGSSTTHYLFEGNRLKEIVPSLVDGGDWATFGLDPTVRPKRFVKTQEWVGKGGETVRRVDRWLYDLDGDTLRLCWPNVFGEFPDELSDQTHGVVTLTRDSGPPPKTKERSGRQPIEVPGVCRLTRDDNFDLWEGEVSLAADEPVTVRIEVEDETDEQLTEAARRLVGWLTANEPAARKFAAERLLDLHNDAWNEGNEIPIEEFICRMTLETASRSPDGGMDLYYHDGDLFWGHCIIVNVSPDGTFQDADIAG